MNPEALGGAGDESGSRVYRSQKFGANGLGVLPLQMVLSAAEARQRSEGLRLEVQRSRICLAESQLAALQARVHPHELDAVTGYLPVVSTRLAQTLAEPKSVWEVGRSLGSHSNGVRLRGGQQLPVSRTRFVLLQEKRGVISR